jgi:hypothetical protein
VATLVVSDSEDCSSDTSPSGLTLTWWRGSFHQKDETRNETKLTCELAGPPVTGRVLTADLKTFYLDYASTNQNNTDCVTARSR